MLVINCEESVRRFSRTKKSFPKPETYKLYVFGMVLCNVHYYECMKLLTVYLKK